jgi:c-di-GMP-binding flagellar brake protein YcgR
MELFGRIAEGNKVEISLKQENSKSHSFVSQVEEVRGNGEFVIVMPVTYGRLVKLPVGDKYTMLFHTAHGMILFDAGIRDYMKDGNIQLMKIKILNEGTRIQQRTHFRYKVDMPVQITRVSDDMDNISLGNEVYYEGIIKNLSGGGMSAVLNHDIPEKNRVKCLIDLENNGNYIIIIGVILQKLYYPSLSRKEYEYRIKFSGLTKADEDAIVQYIFLEQRKELQRLKDER